MSDAGSFAPVAATTRGRTALPPALWRRLLVPVATAILAGAAAGTVVWLMMRPPAPRTSRFAIVESGAAALSVDQVSIDLAITRDGTRIVYKGAGPDNDPQLYVRALDQLEPTMLSGLGRPRAPFFSPDGQWIGYVEVSVSAALKKVAVTGGPSLPLCRLDSPSRGVTWGDDDAIIFATSATSTGLQSVSSAGGEPKVLTTPNRDQGEADHWWPQFLPGSQAVLFTITPTSGGLDASHIAVLDLRTGAVKKIFRGGSQAQYLSGHLVYTAARTLRAVAFDLERLEVTGTPVPVLPQVVTLPNGTAEFDIARDSGTLVYVPGDAGAAPARTLVWVDRQGREEPIKGAPERAYTAPRLSPDGSLMAVSIRDQEDDIWVWDFARETLARVTIDPGIDHSPVWMPDGRQVVFGSQAGGVSGSLFRQSVDGTGTAEPLTKSPIVQFPSGVSRDGGVVFSEGQGTDLAIMMLSSGADPRVKPLVQTPFIERNGEISPDGRWLAYQSNESGQQYEISVRPFPGVNGGKWQVSREGGTQPSWARNSEELFYRSPDGAIMSVPVGHGTTWTAGVPKKVVDAAYYTGGGINAARTYDVSADGKRFLMIKGAADKRFTPPVSIVVVQNWLEDLKRLVPSK